MNEEYILQLMLAPGGKNKQIVRHIYHTTESNLFPMEEEEFSEITGKMKEFWRISEVYTQKLDFSGFFRKKSKEWYRKMVLRHDQM